jgi:hypothetical protein
MKKGLVVVVFSIFFLLLFFWENGWLILICVAQGTIVKKRSEKRGGPGKRAGTVVDGDRLGEGDEGTQRDVPAAVAADGHPGHRRTSLAFPFVFPPINKLPH